jgi:DNA-directed RNA polymerase specialized sigma24 family protein
MVRVAACLLADLASVEDCLHDVFVTVAASASRLEVRGSVRAYLVT